MKLSIVDRVILLNGFFPSRGSVGEMECINSINRKVMILPEERNGLDMEQNEDGSWTVEITDPHNYERDKDFDFTDPELELMRAYACMTDENRAVTSFSLETIKYLTAISMDYEEEKAEG